MSKPIYFTKQMKKEVMEEFAKQLESMNFTDGKIKYETSYYWPKEKDANGKEIEDIVTVVFTKRAKEKQDLLIQEFSTEVGWHGIARRDEKDPKTFWIDDIVIFPQKVTGATVTPEQGAYDTWLMKLPDEQFNHCRYHGHSHVNMGTTPSGTDDAFQMGTLKKLRGDGLQPAEQAKFMEQLGDTAFYIFMIWNKRGEVNVRVYDMMTNRYYSGSEVKIVNEDAHTWADFLAEAKSCVTTHTISYQGYVSPYSGAQYSGYQGLYAQAIGAQSKQGGYKGDVEDKDESHRQYPSEYEDPRYEGFWDGRNWRR